MNRDVLVVGGQGFFGRALVEDLLESTSARIIVAGRRRRPMNGDPRVSWIPFDLARPGPLREYAAVVCCAGPSQGMSTALVRRAADEGVPYVDLADARDFVARARAIRSPAPQMIGLSAVAGLTCLLAGRSKVGRIRSLRTLIAPGSRPMRGGSTLASVFSGIGRWGRREIVRFPSPVGIRAVHRTIEVGDMDVVPDLFAGADFDFKVGFDLDLFNRGMDVLRWLRRRSLAPDPLQHLRLLGGIIRALSLFGTESGAVQVEVSGDQALYVGAVVARKRGYRIPSVLASVAVGRILEGRLLETRLDAWLPELPEELMLRGIELHEHRGAVRTSR